MQAAKERSIFECKVFGGGAFFLSLAMVLSM